MGPARRLVVALVLAGLAGGPPRVALGRKPKPQPCAPGRFLADPSAEPLLAGVSPSIDAVDVQAPGRISLDGCGPASRARIKAKRRFTKITAKWARCGAFAKVRVVATIATPGCDLMSGKIKARRVRARKFPARRSICGDARVDTAGGEGCDTGQACADGGACSACTCGTTSGACTTTAQPLQPPAHVPVGTDVVYAYNPPASGNHYPIWARYEAFTTVIPRPYWVHDLEHGGIVVVHRPDAGATVIDALQAAYQAIPVDPLCGHRRALLTPDPLLTQPFAVLSWGFVMLCDTVDQQAIAEFVTAHRGHGPEQLCADGGYP